MTPTPMPGILRDVSAYTTVHSHSIWSRQSLRRLIAPLLFYI